MDILDDEDQLSMYDEVGNGKGGKKDDLNR